MMAPGVLPDQRNPRSTKMSFMSKNFDLPENIFFFHNTELDQLSFVLKCDTKDKFYLHLLNRFMGHVIKKPDEHSLVLTLPNKNKYFHKYIPAFDIKYIEDCFKLKDYPDPTKYIIQNSCLINYEKNDIFQCWFHRKKSWVDFEPVPRDTMNRVGRGLSIDKVIHCTDNDEDRFSCAPSTVTSCSSNKKTRMPYTSQEDKNIVEYIVKHKGAFKIFGTEIWHRMERANVCKIRTWQSMKERYLKHIKFDLTSSGSRKYPFVNQNELKELRQGLKIDVSTDSQKRSLSSKYYMIVNKDLLADDIN